MVIALSVVVMDEVRCFAARRSGRLAHASTKQEVP
jgi:hypothetical protein